MSAIMPPSFTGPSALDLLAEFRRKHVALAERRCAELRAVMDGHRLDGPSDEMRAAYEEYDSLRYFESELNRVICAFVNEAVKPWQQAFTDAAMQSVGPLTVMRREGKPDA